MIVGQVVDKMPAAHLRRSDASLLDSETLLGVEVEVEGCSKNLPTAKKETGYWTAKEDNSLREGGREFVFAEPLFGADVVAAIRFLCEEAEKQKWVISERTGIHVHVDMRGMELEKFQNFCVLYALTEPLIYRWVGDKRERNIHCLPWYIADADLEQISAIFRQPKTAMNNIKNINRYAGLNLNSLLSFGTAEFRQLKTTFSADRILEWINILLSLRLAANAWQGDPAQLIPEMKLLGAFGFAHKIFGNLVHKLWYPEFNTHFVGTSIPIAEHLLREANPAQGAQLARNIERHRLNELDESGDHPGVLRFRDRKKSKAPSGRPQRVVKTNFGEFLVDDQTNKAVPVPSTQNGAPLMPSDFWAAAGADGMLADLKKKAADYQFTYQPPHPGEWPAVNKTKKPQAQSLYKSIKVTPTPSDEEQA